MEVNTTTHHGNPKLMEAQKSLNFEQNVYVYIVIAQDTSTPTSSEAIVSNKLDLHSSITSSNACNQFIKSIKKQDTMVGSYKTPEEGLSKSWFIQNITVSNQ